MNDVLGIKLYKPQEVASMLGIGKNKIYELMNSREMEYVSWGKSEKRITAQGIRSHITSRTVRKDTPRLYSKA